jgi:hypothetical protein
VTAVRPSVIALLTVCSLASAIASAQVGRYNPDEVQAHKEQLARKAKQWKSRAIQCMTSCGKSSK